MNQLGRNIKKQRLKNNMTQLDLAESMGNKKAVQISLWENGLRYPGSENIVLLCSALNCEPNDLYEGCLYGN